MAPPGHALTQPPAVRAADILRETVILRESGSGTRIMSIRLFDRLGEGTPYQTIEMDSNETIKQSVIAGLGIAILSRHTVTEELNSGHLVEIKAPQLPIARTRFVLHDAGLVRTGAIEMVLGFIKSANGSFLPT